ncbi:hypothetical protein AB4072_10520 [Microvirga sp. 2MCAF38]
MEELRSKPLGRGDIERHERKEAEAQQEKDDIKHDNTTRLGGKTYDRPASRLDREERGRV